MIEETLKVWAAGVFDGEGSALIEKTGEHSYQITVAVATTDPNISNTVMGNWGGHYRSNRDLNTWRKTSGTVFKMDCSVYFREDEAYRFLLDILPYVRTKRKDIQIVITAIVSLSPIQRNTGKRARGSLQVLEPFYNELKKVRALARTAR